MAFVIKNGHFLQCPKQTDRNVEPKCWCKLWGYGIATVFALSLAIFEIWGGYTSGSIALLVDAAHVSSDTVVYMTSAWAFYHKVGEKKHVVRQIDDMWGIRNSWILTAVAFGMIGYALWRLFFVEIEIPTERMLWVASLGFVINVIMYFILKALDVEHKHSSTDDHVHESAILHTISDAAISVVVIVVALIILFFPNAPLLSLLDPVASVFVCIWLIYRAHRIRAKIQKRHSRHHH